MLSQVTKSVQTAFRFSPELIRLMKNRARMNGQSLNNYIEGLVKKDLEKSEGRYETIYRSLSQIKIPDTVSPDLMDLSKYKVEFTKEEIDRDERLSYLLSK